jgi:hypothetical protein
MTPLLLLLVGVAAPAPATATNDAVVETSVRLLHGKLLGAMPLLLGQLSRG